MNRAVLLTALAALTSPLGAWDYGAGVEETTALTQDSLTQTFVLRPWVRWLEGNGTEFHLKANLTDTVEVDRTDGNRTTNTVAGDLDALSYTLPFGAGPGAGSVTFGRTDLRDFDGTLLSTTVDGVKASVRWGGWELRGAAGTTALLFKTGTTVAVSSDDLEERSVTADLSQVETLMAPPRLVVYTEATLPKLLEGQSFQAALAGQVDLRSGTARDGDTVGSTEHQAPVSMLYAGAGGEGRIAGPLSWTAAAWVGAGASLTEVASSSTTTREWKASTILNGWGSAAVTLVQPDWGHSVAGLGLQVGSGDEDGPSPASNGAEGKDPTPYNGWFGISRKSVSPVLAAQPGDLLAARAFWSVKPFAGGRNLAESLQAVATVYAFTRTSTGTYRGTEADLNLLWRPASDWGASAAFGAFLPSADEVDQENHYLAQLGLNLSF